MAKAKKPAVKKQPKPADPAAEAEAARLLAAYDAGDIDNAWDVIHDLFELDKRLSKQSPLRARFNKMYEDLETICRENS